MMNKKADKLENTSVLLNSLDFKKLTITPNVKLDSNLIIMAS